ncbi:MAG: AI-2E family transporter [Oligoflexales bacterium]
MNDRLVKSCLLILTALAVTIALIHLKGVLIPFVISIFIYFLVIPFVDYSQRKLRLPQVLGLLFALILSLMVTGILSITVLSSLETFLADTKLYQENLAQLVEKASELLAKFGINMGNEFANLQKNLRNLPIFNFIKGMAKEAFGVIGQFFLIIIYLMFLVSGHDMNASKSKVRSKIEESVQKYIVTKVIASLATGLMVGILLKLIGMDLAFMFGVLTFLLNFIPSIGSLIAIFLPLPVAFLQFEFGIQFYLVLILPSAVQFVIGNVIEPKVMGEGLGLHPVTILLCLMIWSSIWGAAGMFLAVPMTVCIKIVCEQFSISKPLVKLMSGG